MFNLTHYNDLFSRIMSSIILIVLIYYFTDKENRKDFPRLCFCVIIFDISVLTLNTWWLICYFIK